MDHVGKQRQRRPARATKASSLSQKRPGPPPPSLATLWQQPLPKADQPRKLGDPLQHNDPQEDEISMLSQDRFPAVVAATGGSHMTLDQFPFGDGVSPSAQDPVSPLSLSSDAHNTNRGHAAAILPHPASLAYLGNVKRHSELSGSGDWWDFGSSGLTRAPTPPMPAAFKVGTTPSSTANSDVALDSASVAKSLPKAALPRRQEGSLPSQDIINADGDSAFGENVIAQPENTIPITITNEESNNFSSFFAPLDAPISSNAGGGNRAFIPLGVRQSIKGKQFPVTPPPSKGEPRPGAVSVGVGGGIAVAQPVGYTAAVSATSPPLCSSSSPSSSLHHKAPNSGLNDYKYNDAVDLNNALFATFAEEPQAANLAGVEVTPASAAADAGGGSAAATVRAEPAALRMEHLLMRSRAGTRTEGECLEIAALIQGVNGSSLAGFSLQRLVSLAQRLTLAHARSDSSSSPSSPSSHLPSQSHHFPFTGAGSSGCEEDQHGPAHRDSTTMKEGERLSSQSSQYPATLFRPGDKTIGFCMFLRPVSAKTSGDAARNSGMALFRHSPLLSSRGVNDLETAHVIVRSQSSHSAPQHGKNAVVTTFDHNHFRDIDDLVTGVALSASLVSSEQRSDNKVGESRRGRIVDENGECHDAGEDDDDRRDEGQVGRGDIDQWLRAGSGDSEGSEALEKEQGGRGGLTEWWDIQGERERRRLKWEERDADDSTKEAVAPMAALSWNVEMLRVTAQHQHFTEQPHPDHSKRLGVRSSSATSQPHRVRISGDVDGGDDENEIGSTGERERGDNGDNKGASTMLWESLGVLAKVRSVGAFHTFGEDALERNGRVSGFPSPLGQQHQQNQPTSSNSDYQEGVGSAAIKPEAAAAIGAHCFTGVLFSDCLFAVLAPEDYWGCGEDGGERENALGPTLFSEANHVTQGSGNFFLTESTSDSVDREPLGGVGWRLPPAPRPSFDWLRGAHQRYMQEQRCLMLLESLPSVFGGLSDQARRWLCSCAQERTFQPGDTVVEVGREVNIICVVESGAVIPTTNRMHTKMMANATGAVVAASTILAANAATSKAEEAAVAGGRGGVSAVVPGQEWFPGDISALEESSAIVAASSVDTTENAMWRCSALETSSQKQRSAATKGISAETVPPPPPLCFGALEVLEGIPRYVSGAVASLPANMAENVAELSGLLAAAAAKSPANAREREKGGGVSMGQSSRQQQPGNSKISSSGSQYISQHRDSHRRSQSLSGTGASATPLPNPMTVDSQYKITTTCFVLPKRSYERACMTVTTSNGGSNDGQPLLLQKIIARDVGYDERKGGRPVVRWTLPSIATSSNSSTGGSSTHAHAANTLKTLPLVLPAATASATIGPEEQLLAQFTLPTKLLPTTTPSSSSSSSSVPSSTPLSPFTGLSTTVVYPYGSSSSSYYYSSTDAPSLFSEETTNTTSDGTSLGAASSSSTVSLLSASSDALALKYRQKRMGGGGSGGGGRDSKRGTGGHDVLFSNKPGSRKKFQQQQQQQQPSSLSFGGGVGGGGGGNGGASYDGVGRMVAEAEREHVVSSAPSKSMAATVTANYNNGTIDNSNHNLIFDAVVGRKRVGGEALPMKVTRELSKHDAKKLQFLQRNLASINYVPLAASFGAGSSVLSRKS